MAMQTPTTSRLKRRAQKALTAAAMGTTVVLTAACSNTSGIRAPLESGATPRPVAAQPAYTGHEYNEQRQIAMELGYTVGGVYVGQDSQRVVLRRVDTGTRQIRWGFNNYGEFTDEGTYRVVGSREGCWMTYRATFLDLQTRTEFTGLLAKPHLMDEFNCKRISATWGPIRDGIQGARNAIRRATPGPAYDERYYGGYGSRGVPEPYTGGGYYYPRRSYGW